MAPCSSRPDSKRTREGSSQDDSIPEKRQRSVKNTRQAGTEKKNNSSKVGAIILFNYIYFYYIIIQPKKQVKLKRSMEKTLKNGGWLTDEHVQLAQEILKDQFPHVDGFQSPLLVQNDGFVPVQGEGKHFFHQLFSY